MNDNRRPIKTRSSALVQTVARHLTRHDISPNHISVASMIFAGAGALAINLDVGVTGSLLCVVAIQLRLLCNLLDGMVAIEGGKLTALGSVFNEFPDRVADSVLILGLGYAIGHGELGWFAALAAALTAYIRTFGGSLGLKQAFIGPMAKQHRMAAMTLGLVISAIEGAVLGTHHSLLITLWIIAAGSVATCITRTRAICRQLEGAFHVAR